MDEIIIDTKNPLWFMEECNELLEYTEGGLANHIFELVDQSILKEQREVMASLVEVSPAMAELANGLKKTQRLKLVFSDEVKGKIADGTYRLMKKKDIDGVFKAVVVDQKGKTKAIADLKWDEVSKGVDPSRLTSAMQGMAIQQQLREIASQLEDMSVSMEEILIGQHNDRLALFYSGEAIYREALAATDPERKKQLTTSAILALTNASVSLQVSLAFEINEICSKYDFEKGKFIGIKSNKLQDKMCLINSSFQTIHKAMTLKAAIYYKDREYAALTAVLSDYEAFLQRSLTEQNARILYLADPNEKNLTGSWDIRKNELPMQIERTKELLSKPAMFALEATQEDII